MMRFEELTYAAHVSCGVWIGACYAVFDKLFLNKNNIRTIVNVCAKAFCTPFLHSAPPAFGERPFNVHFCHIDDITIDRDMVLTQHMISKMLDRLDEKIEDSLKDGNVLVHCQAGINRSAMVISHFLMHRRSMSYEEAISHVTQANRSRGEMMCLTNHSFRRILALSKPQDESAQKIVRILAQLDDLEEKEEDDESEYGFFPTRRDEEEEEEESEWEEEGDEEEKTEYNNVSVSEEPQSRGVEEEEE